jgi:hypothetical protein
MRAVVPPLFVLLFCLLAPAAAKPGSGEVMPPNANRGSATPGIQHIGDGKSDKPAAGPATDSGGIILFGVLAGAAVVGLVVYAVSRRRGDDKA